MFMTNPTDQPNGFCISFSNGYKVSVQWGLMNYCSNKGNRMKKRGELCHSVSAEILLMTTDGDSVRDGAGVFETTDGVTGWCHAEEVARILYKVSQLEDRKEKDDD